MRYSSLSFCLLPSQLQLLEDVPLLGVGPPGVAQPGVFVGTGGAGGQISHYIEVSLSVRQGAFVGRLASCRHFLNSLLCVRLGQSVSQSVRSHGFIIALPGWDGTELADGSGLRHPEEGLGPGDEVDPVLGLDPVKPVRQGLSLLQSCEPVGVESQGVGGSVGLVVAEEILLQPLQDLLPAEVSEDTLVQEGTVAAQVTLHVVRVEWDLPEPRELPGGAGLLLHQTGPPLGPACPTLVLYGIRAPIIGPFSAWKPPIPFAIKNRRGASKDPLGLYVPKPIVGGFGCPSWFFMA